MASTPSSASPRIPLRIAMIFAGIVGLVGLTVAFSFRSNHRFLSDTFREEPARTTNSSNSGLHVTPISDNHASHSHTHTDTAGHTHSEDEHNPFSGPKPSARKRATTTTAHSLDDHEHAATDASADHEHDASHAHDDEPIIVQLSPQALGTLGLTPDQLTPLALETFWRTISVPAMVVERPGRTRLEVATPMAGVVTHVHAIQGEAVEPGSLLFELRITAEELVSTQTELLKTLGALEVEKREIERLTDVTRTGAVAQKTLIEREYARDKLEVLLAAQKEALRLQGLSDRQISEIVNTRRLLRDLRIVAPYPDDHQHHELQLSQSPIRPAEFTTEIEAAPSEIILPHAADRAPADADEATDATESHATPLDASQSSDKHSTPLILQDLKVHKGEIVSAGSTLAVVSDLSELYIEGRAFEQDGALLTTAAQHRWGVTGIIDRTGQAPEEIPNLELLYSASDVHIESRTLRFYVRLPNHITRDVPSPNGLRYVDWKYRPGQRLQLRVPVEQWTERLVVPLEAVAEEGVESFTFRQTPHGFERVPVQIDYRDANRVVLGADGTLKPGDVIARRGAHQIQMALKNQSNGGLDPHAGHSH